MRTNRVKRISEAKMPMKKISANTPHIGAWIRAYGGRWCRELASDLAERSERYERADLVLALNGDLILIGGHEPDPLGKIGHFMRCEGWNPLAFACFGRADAQIDILFEPIPDCGEEGDLDWATRRLRAQIKRRQPAFVQRDQQGHFHMCARPRW